MTAPKHARDIKGKGRYYGSCSDDCPFGDRLFISITNAQDVVNKPALPPSAAKITAAAAWDRLPQMVATSRQPVDGKPADGGKPCEKRRVADRCGSCRFCVTSAIKAEYKQQWETKRDLGTRIHNAAHGHVLGEPVAYDPEIEPFLKQYLLFLDVWRVDLDRDVEAAETTIVDWDNEYAGTGDIWLHLPIGPGGRRKLVLIDIKTSVDKPADTVYADQPLQLAALRYAPKALLNDDTEIDVPEFHGTAILNLRPTSHALVPIPTDRDTHKAFLGAATLQRHFHSQDIKAWVPLDAPALPEPTRKAS
ncbi:MULTISPECIES: hypothetical protein [unclassified Nocardioides]|uniref:hypothetical protein n=1 Tax=unclassified Nocardioides TaxID=2615069 RepID=UPI0009EFECCD|nr:MULTISPECIES: hypothetical protein [unclassified Nocardioides]GAW50581.1 Putative uncharacterized protein [Nocardioides sp. PD653-B2]GAW57466.1 putative uncharacterized protein [Nocardioides sp. PD653]